MPRAVPTQPDSPDPSKIFLQRISNCINYLNTQYLTLLRAASSENALDAAHDGAMDPRAGGGAMKDPKEPAPPLAATATLSSLQAKLSAQNICVATSQLLDIIRILRLSALIMDGETADMEEDVECLENGIMIEDTLKEIITLEEELRIRYVS